MGKQVRIRSHWYGAQVARKVFLFYLQDPEVLPDGIVLSRSSKYSYVKRHCKIGIELKKKITPAQWLSDYFTHDPVR